MVFGLEECCTTFQRRSVNETPRTGVFSRNRRCGEPVSRATHPLVGTVREELVLPDRHLCLHGVHQIRARSKGRPPVTSTHDRHERRIADRQPARSMDHRHRHDVMTATDLLGYLFQNRTRVGVSLVFEVGHRSPMIMVADRSDKTDNRSRTTIRDDALKDIDADRAVNDVGEHDGAGVDEIGHADILPYGLRRNSGMRGYCS
jgi:hypothetical protein